MTIDRRFLDELRERLPLSDIIGQRVKLVRAGNEFKACCPFHKEKTPSFYVNDQKGFYHCFGCGAHGDVLSFKMRHDNMGFMDAVEDLAARAGMEVPQPSEAERQKYDRAKVLYDVLEDATQWFQAQLHAPDNKFAADYVRNRGILPQALEEFRIGYAPNSWDKLREAMQARGHKLSDLLELGLLKQSNRDDKKDQPYSFFRGRIIFPVTDKRGRVIAFGGRHLEEAFDPTRRDGNTPPKYLNSPDHPVFSKGQLLYGMARARQAAAKGAPVILAEGYMDVIALAQAGFVGAVAPLGTAVTENQIDLLWRLCAFENKNPILCFDGDNAGKRAAYRVLDRALPLLKPDQSLRFAFMPAGEDPDSLVKAKGRGAMDKILKEAVPLIEVIWARETEGRQFLTPEARAGLASRLEKAVQNIQDSGVRRFYLTEVKDRVYKAFGRSNSRQGMKKNTTKLSRLRNNKQVMRAKILLASVINHPQLLELFSEVLGILDIPSPDLDSLRQSILAIAMTQDPLDRTTLKDLLSEEGFESTLLDLLSEKTYMHADFAKPDADFNAVCNGCEDIWALMQKDQMASETRIAAHQVAEDFTDKNVQRVVSLGRQTAGHQDE